MQLLFMKRMLSSFFFPTFVQEGWKAIFFEDLYNIAFRALKLRVHANGQILKSLATALSFYTGTFTNFVY